MGQKIENFRKFFSENDISDRFLQISAKKQRSCLIFACCIVIYSEGYKTQAHDRRLDKMYKRNQTIFRAAAVLWGSLLASVIMSGCSELPVTEPAKTESTDGSPFSAGRTV